MSDYTIDFYGTFLNIPPKCVFTALYYCYKAGATWNCCSFGAFGVHQDHTTMHNVTSLHAKPHMYGACVLSSACNLPPALLAEWLGSFTCYCSNTGAERIQNKSWHRKFTPEKKNPTTYWIRNKSQRSKLTPEKKITPLLTPACIQSTITLAKILLFILGSHQFF